jgi:vacuolar protein sorting-associated protein 33A
MNRKEVFSDLEQLFIKVIGSILLTVNKKDFYLFFLPHKSLLCEKHLQVKGVHGSFQQIGEFKCEFFPTDCDVISMELRDAFR